MTDHAYDLLLNGSEQDLRILDKRMQMGPQATVRKASSIISRRECWDVWLESRYGGSFVNWYQAFEQAVSMHRCMWAKRRDW